jgi:hypothetical protein
MGFPLLEGAISDRGFGASPGQVNDRPMRLVKEPTNAPGRVYVGERGRAGCRVVVIDHGEEAPLRPRAPDPLWSFSWGRPGASARELAWSMIYDSARDHQLADDWCSELSTSLIARLPHDSFCIAASDLLAWLYEDSSVRTGLCR